VPEVSMKYCLIVANGKHQGMPIPVTIDLFMIGSGKMCQLRTKVEGIAEQHCALVSRDKKVFIRDLGSAFTTKVNGELIPDGEEWPLHAGDRIAVGPLEFMIQFTEKKLSKRDLDEWALKCLDRNKEMEESLSERIEESLNNVNRNYYDAADAANSIIEQLTIRRGVVKGRLRIGREGDITHVRVNDPYLVEDAELAFVKKELYDNLNTRNLRVLLDLKTVRKMTSMAASIIAELGRYLQRNGGRMALCRLRPELLDTLQDLPALQGLPVFKDKAAAIREKW